MLTELNPESAQTIHQFIYNRAKKSIQVLDRDGKEFNVSPTKETNRNLLWLGGLGDTEVEAVTLAGIVGLLNLVTGRNLHLEEKKSATEIVFTQR